MICSVLTGDVVVTTSANIWRVTGLAGEQDIGVAVDDQTKIEGKVFEGLRTRHGSAPGDLATRSGYVLGGALVSAGGHQLSDGGHRVKVQTRQRRQTALCCRLSKTGTVSAVWDVSGVAPNVSVRTGPMPICNTIGTGGRPAGNDRASRAIQRCQRGDAGLPATRSALCAR